ncbi:MAG: DegV family protein [Actinomycetota bacterium]|nr:DegV family protein [Actinomycetota bacterium]
MKQEVGIVTCSAACLPKDYVEEYGIKVVPLTLIIGDKSYRDGVDITPGEFYRAMEKDFASTSTSAPSVGDYIEAFESLAGKYSSAVCITLSREYSASINSAMTAASKVDSIRIEVVDSKNAATAQGFVVREAARLAREGKSLEEVKARAEWVVDRVKLLGILDTLDYLKKSGRVGGLSAYAAGKLNIKPILIVENGETKTFAKPRSRKKAYERIISYLNENVAERGPLHLSVTYAGMEDEAQRFAELLKSRVEHQEFIMAEFTPVMGKHTGPVLIGTGFY